MEIILLIIILLNDFINNNIKIKLNLYFFLNIFKIEIVFIIHIQWKEDYVV